MLFKNKTNKKPKIHKQTKPKNPPLPPPQEKPNPKLKITKNPNQMKKKKSKFQEALGRQKEDKLHF